MIYKYVSGLADKITAPLTTSIYYGQEFKIMHYIIPHGLTKSFAVKATSNNLPCFSYESTTPNTTSLASVPTVKAF